MTDWKISKPLHLALLASACLTLAWTWSPLFFFVLPGWLLLFQLASQKKRPLLFLYLAFALWNAAMGISDEMSVAFEAKVNKKDPEFDDLIPRTGKKYLDGGYQG